LVNLSNDDFNKPPSNFIDDRNNIDIVNSTVINSLS
jgi:hypothetical protein